jgi:hypothetical protein
MTINERRDSAEKKACDDARDLNSLARGFMSNEEANIDTTKQALRVAKMRHHPHRHIAPQSSALLRSRNFARPYTTTHVSRSHVRYWWTITRSSTRSHARSTDERPVRSHRAAASPIPGRLGQDGGPRQRHQGISPKAAGSRRAHSPKHIDNQWLSNMLNMIGVPICRSRLVLFSGAEIKKVGE